MRACPACNTRYDDNTTYCVRDGSPVVPDVLPPAAPMIGQLIGDRYKIIKKIGEGGMGEVYVAEHIHIEKRVALKLLRSEVLSNQEAVQRFRIEARSASSIGHDNIIQIDDFGTLPDGRVYMAMEYLQGSPLNDLLAREPLPMPRALDILIQVSKGLSAAHAKGITHRDMKPENVFVTNKEGRDVPKILDFGIAKVSGGDTAQNLTVAGTIFGTPFYMSPEQAMGGKMDHRCDIYAMGIILYEVFCGTVPFKAETFMGILTQHITQAPVPPSQMAAQNGRICPPELEAIILKAIQKDPNQRYQSMAELTNALIDFYRLALGGGGATQTPWGNQYFSGQPWSPSGSVSVGAITGRKPKPGGGKKGWVLPVAIASVVLIGGGAVAVVMMSRGQPTPLVTNPDKPGPDKPGPASLTPDAAAVAVKPAVPDAAPVVVHVATPDAATQVAAHDVPPRDDKPHRDDPVDRPGARTVDVTLVSRPPGAAIYRGNTLVGDAPQSVSVKQGEKTKFTMKLDGYRELAFTVDGTRKVEEKRLVRKELQYVNPDLKPPDDDGLAVPKGGY